VTAQPGRLVLLGHPVGHSLSPVFQNAALHAANIPLVYELLDVPTEALDRVLAGLVAESGAGNVTIPHKGRVAERCHRLLPLAVRTGAVNTFWTEHGRLIGDNTDVAGFTAAVRDLLGEVPHDIEVAMIGAGGGAAGVLAAIEGWGGCRVRLYNRTVAHAESLAARFHAFATVAESSSAATARAALVVNATSVGLHDDSLPFDVEALAPSAAVLDLVYRPGASALVRAARALGHRAGGGLEMLVAQGALAFERWFGVAPDRALMWEAVRHLG